MIYFFLKTGNFKLETYLNEKESKNKQISMKLYTLTVLQIYQATSYTLKSELFVHMYEGGKKTRSKVIVAQNFSTRTEPHGFTTNVSLISTSDSLHTRFCYFYMQNYRFLNSTNWWPSKASKQSIKQFEEYFYSPQILHNPL